MRKAGARRKRKPDRLRFPSREGRVLSIRPFFIVGRAGMHYTDSLLFSGNHFMVRHCGINCFKIEAPHRRL
jgi:hypothetical protein